MPGRAQRVDGAVGRSHDHCGGAPTGIAHERGGAVDGVRRLEGPLDGAGLLVDRVDLAVERGTVQRSVAPEGRRRDDEVSRGNGPLELPAGVEGEDRGVERPPVRGAVGGNGGGGPHGVAGAVLEAQHPVRMESEGVAARVAGEQGAVVGQLHIALPPRHLLPGRVGPRGLVTPEDAVGGLAHRPGPQLVQGTVGGAEGDRRCPGGATAEYGGGVDDVARLESPDELSRWRDGIEVRIRGAEVDRAVPADHRREEDALAGRERPRRVAVVVGDDRTGAGIPFVAAHLRPR